MNRPAAAALAAFLASTAFAAAPDSARSSGTVRKAAVSVDGAGSLTIVDDAGHETAYFVRGSTKLTRDGEKIKFDTALIGDMVVRAKFNPKTKTLTVLDLKTAPAAKTAAKADTGPASGEVALADALKGALSVRTGPGKTREFAVVDATKVVREGAEGKPSREVEFETVTVGESVTVLSRDGKTADEIRVRAAAR